MANTQSTGTIPITNRTYFQEALVDTNPGAPGYGCLPVKPKLADRTVLQNNLRPIQFYIKSLATGAIITVQWKRDGDADWSDYERYNTLTRQALVEPPYNVSWKAVVKSGEQGSAGSSVFGFDW